MTGAFELSPLSTSFGAEVHGLDLTRVRADSHYPELRGLFEEHSALLFRDQALSDEALLRLGRLFGPIEDRNAEDRAAGEPAPVSKVSNETAEGGLTGITDLHTLHLIANQQWHVDSSFMPVPALCNILTARVVSKSGGETELASTRAAWAAMPEKLKSRIRMCRLGHNYRTSRERVSPELAKQAMFSKWPDQYWPAVWANPANGREALYLASHVFEVQGMEKAAGLRLIDELIDFCTRPAFAYSHRWRVGDVLIWDQRAVMHRGRPWPYDQPRTLASVCCSMTDADGLAVAKAATSEHQA